MQNTVTVAASAVGGKIPNYEIFYDVPYDSTGVTYEKYENNNLVTIYTNLQNAMHKVWYKKINDMINKLEHYTYYLNDSIIREEFYLNGNLHFDYELFGHIRKKVEPFDVNDRCNHTLIDLNDNIAVIYYDESGKVVNVENWLYGVQQPVMHLERTKKWYEINGILHNENGPAYEEYYQHVWPEDDDDEDAGEPHPDDGTIIKQVWMQNGKYYRVDDGPTEVLRDINNHRETEYWYNTDGMLQCKS